MANKIFYGKYMAHKIKIDSLNAVSIKQGIQNNCHSTMLLATLFAGNERPGKDKG
jgi:hypothetical protein